MQELEELNNFSPKAVDLTLYNDFKRRTERLEGDVGYYQAFKFAQESNQLIGYYMTHKVKAEGKLREAKAELETLKANKSIELGENVSDGDRKAMADQEVREQKKYINKLERYVNYLEGVIEKLNKTHYLMKQRYQEGEQEKARSEY